MPIVGLKIERLSNNSSRQGHILKDQDAQCQFDELESAESPI